MENDELKSKLEELVRSKLEDVHFILKMTESAIEGMPREKYLEELLDVVAKTAGIKTVLDFYESHFGAYPAGIKEMVDKMYEGFRKMIIEG